VQAVISRQGSEGLGKQSYSVFAGRMRQVGLGRSREAEQGRTREAVIGR
jgi:hypothetical protein